VTGDIEDAKRAIADLLRSQALLDAIAAIDTEKGDGLITPSPAAVWEGEKKDLATPGYPAAEVIGVRTTYDLDVDGRKIGTDRDEKFAVHEIHVFWTVSGFDEMQITKWIQRIVKASRMLIWPEDGRVTLPNIHAAPLAVRSEDYTALQVDKNTNAFLKGSWTVVLVPTITT